VKQKTTPTVNKLLCAIKSQIHFPRQKCVLICTLRETGFILKRSLSHGKVLLKRCNIIDWWCRYLVQMQEVRENGTNVLSINKIWVASNLTTSKCWQGPGARVVDTVSGNNRLIVVHISSNDDSYCAWWTTSV
jgi:hypothetical protein